MSEIEVQDAIIRQALELQRLSAGDEARALEIMRELERELTTILASQDLTTANRREIEAIVRSARDAIDGRYTLIGNVVDTHELMLVVAQNTVRVLAGTMPTTSPTPERLASLSRDILIDGAPASAWWARQAEDTAFKFAREVRQGVIDGATNEQITARIFGRGDEPGILETARRNVRSLVHSSIMTAANRARLEVYKKSGATGIKWLSTLDSHTCLTCMALDGSQWDMDGKPLGDTTLDFKLPPAHTNCRCVATPITRSMADILGVETGYDAAVARLSMRASSQGPIPNTTFAGFLDRQTPEFITEVLGRGRAELWRAGKLTLSDLVSGSGRPLTLTQLQARRSN